MVTDSSPRIAGAGVDLVRTIKTNVLFGKIGIAGPRHARASLAVAAMTHVDNCRLARGDDPELTAQALRGSCQSLPPQSHASSEDIPNPDESDLSVHRPHYGHSRECGDPGVAAPVPVAWVPAFAGMTTRWSGINRHQLELVVLLGPIDAWSGRAEILWIGRRPH